MPPSTRIKPRRGTAAQWIAVNPVLQEGEIGVETDTGRMLFGDGSSAWTSLTRGLVPLSQKAAANGVATLDAGGKIPTGQLPNLAIGDVFTVASEAAMLALDAQKGDIAVRTDLNPDGVFWLGTNDPTVAANWIRIGAIDLTTDGPTATPSLRTLGHGANQAFPGDANPATRIPADTYVDTTASAQTKDGPLRIPRITLGEEPIDPTHPRFAGGAKFDNSTVDDAAWAEVESLLGNTTTQKAAKLVLPSGTTVVTTKRSFNYKWLDIEGIGIGRRSNTGMARGSWFRWQGTNTDPVLEFRSMMQGRLANFGVVNLETDPARRPKAAISFARLSGDPTVNTKNMLSNLVLGGLEGVDTMPSGQYHVGAGILVEDGLNHNNDQTIVDNVKVYGAEFGTRLALNQAVLWTFRNCLAKACGTAWYSVAQINLDDCIAAASVVRDLDVAGGLWTLGRFSSEGSAQLARVRGTSKLLLRGGYFLYTNSLTDSGSAVDVRIIDADGDINQQAVLLEDFDFRDGGYTNPGTLRAVAIGTPVTGALSRKELIIRRCLFGSNALQESHVLVSLPSAGPKVFLFGEQYAPKNASGFYDTRRFWNELTSTAATPDFSKDKGILVQDENVNVSTQVNQIDFVGADVTVTAGTGEVIVNVGAGSAQARTTANQAIADATLTNITGLSFPIGASEVWVFEAMLIYDSTSTNELRVAATIPSGSVVWGGNGLATTGNAGVGDVNVSAIASSGVGIAYGGGRAAGAGVLRQVVMLRGTAANGPIPGTVQIQAAKAINTDTSSPADDATIFANSHITAKRI